MTPSAGLLDQARAVLQRVYTLGLLHLLTATPPLFAEQTPWAERGIAELLAVARWNTSIGWNPKAHFLDTAELSHAVGVGYDWLFHAMNSSARAAVGGVLLANGLRAGLASYTAPTPAWWWQDNCNWNIVCNGGLSVGALALWDDLAGNASLAVAAPVLNYALSGLPHALRSYGPDGAWPEGVVYWGYATRYLAYTLSAHATALHTDHGFAATPGINATGAFALSSTGAPGRDLWAWADSSSTEAVSAKNLFFLGRLFSQPALAFAARSLIPAGADIEAQDLLWYSSAGSQADLDRLPRTALFRVNVNDTLAAGAATPATSAVQGRPSLLVARASWAENATWLAAKGGDAYANHNHLDLGSFSLAMGGVRWAFDMGADSYALPGYFSKDAQRYHYYRLNNRGHNTLTFGGLDQDIHATAEAELVAPTTPLLSGHQAAPADFQGIIHLEQAYAPAKVAARRGLALSDNYTRLLVLDEFNGTAAVNLSWAMHAHDVDFAIADDGLSAVARSSADPSAAPLHIQLLTSGAGWACPAARLSTAAVDLQPPQRSSTGVHKLLASAPSTDPAACSGLAVSMGLSAWSLPDSSTKILSLSSWGVQ